MNGHTRIPPFLITLSTIVGPLFTNDRRVYPRARDHRAREENTSERDHTSFVFFIILSWIKFQPELQAARLRP